VRPPVKEYKFEGSMPIPAKDGLSVSETFPAVPGVLGGAREMEACAFERAA